MIGQSNAAIRSIWRVRVSSICFGCGLSGFRTDHINRALLHLVKDAADVFGRRYQLTIAVPRSGTSASVPAMAGKAFVGPSLSADLLRFMPAIRNEVIEQRIDATWRSAQNRSSMRRCHPPMRRGQLQRQEARERHKLPRRIDGRVQPLKYYAIEFEHCAIPLQEADCAGRKFSLKLGET